jgi:alpha-tubulin suppressor-like RCC1 family protein
MQHLYCWGDNRRGQGGNGDAQRASITHPTQIGSTMWQSLAAGANHTCAVDLGSQLWCWGADDDGALLDGMGWRSDLVSVAVPP